MSCCSKNRGKKFQVVTAGGKVVFETASKPTADAVSKRYPNSKVEEKAPPSTTVSTQKTPGGA